MPNTAAIYIACGTLAALALGSLLIYMMRKSAYQQGFAVAEKVQAETLTKVQHEGDIQVAARRDPHDVAVSLSNGEF